MTKLSDPNYVPKKTIAVDLDGVLAEYDGWKGINHIGDPIPHAREFLTELRKLGSVLIFTTRCSAVDPTLPTGEVRATPHELRAHIVEWLDKHDLPWDGVWIGQGKPIAAAYVDDRAVECAPQKAHFPRACYQGAVCLVAALLES